MIINEAKIFENSKYIRFNLKKINLYNLYSILKNPYYSCFFVGFEEEKILVRYKIEKVKNYNNFIDFISHNLRKFESGLNSEDINLLDATFIDCYKTTLDNREKN